MNKTNRYLIGFFVFLVFSLIATVFIVTLDSILAFTSSPTVVNFFPEDGAQSVALNSSIIIKLDKPIKRREIQASIFPEAYGEWKFEDPVIKNYLFKTLVFIPALDFKPDIQYQVRLENIKGFGSQKTNSFQFSFKTGAIEQKPFHEEGEFENEQDKNKENQNKEIEISSVNKPEPKITMFNIDIDWQDYSLSCEAASLKMALAGKGIFVSETEIMEKIGYDLTPHNGNTWGNPYEKYVGDIDGKMCQTGYGVYWEPVAKAAQNWTEAEVFSNWGITDLTYEIAKGNPVVIWGVLPTGTLTDCSWWTSEEKYIKAFKETHVRLAIGFIGLKDNPSQIIINDPLSGRLYWSTSYFLQNWAAFNYSGVVIR